MMQQLAWKTKKLMGTSNMKTIKQSYTVREVSEISNNISDYLKRHEEKDMLRFLTCGSVDDGKSTLIGRLLYDSHMIYEDQMSSLLKDSKIHGSTSDEFDPALLTDGLRAEREQGITIDVAYRYFSTEKRSFIICDSPGHEQYTRNMATGASHCNLAIILIDARNGVLPQTKRHSFISSLLGIKHLVVAVNKMDIIDYKENVYRNIRKQYEAFAAKLEVSDIHFIPISALKGDNVVDSSENMPWFKGEPLLSYLENVQLASDRNLIDFRFPVQYVLRPNLNFRGFAGTIASGVIRKGEEIKVYPSGRTTKIKSIETYDGELTEAFAPQSVVLTTTDQIDISRGDMIARPNNVPNVGDLFDASLVWMSERPANKNNKFILKTATRQVPAEISDIRYKFDVNSLHREEADTIVMNDIARVEIKTHRAVCFDYYVRNPKTGSFILIDTITNETVAAGMINEFSPETHRSRQVGKDPVSENIFWSDTDVTEQHRARMLGHKPATVWLTGLSGSGKSTVARALEKRLVSMGVAAFVLDGDNVRHGLNKDLGFSAEDRTENIRRISEVAKLMNDAGVVVITAFISPFLEDRKHARSIIGEGKFIETFIDADLEICQQRDPKGLYKKVAEGKIGNFTGVDSPYEKPTSPEVQLKTGDLSVDESVDVLVKKLLELELIEKKSV